MMHIIILKFNTTRGASLVVVLYSDYGNHAVYYNNVCIIILMYPDSSPFNILTTQVYKGGGVWLHKISIYRVIPLANEWEMRMRLQYVREYNNSNNNVNINLGTTTE